jgi:hypothetical protein
MCFNGWEVGERGQQTDSAACNKAYNVMPTALVILLFCDCMYISSSWFALSSSQLIIFLRVEIMHFDL